MTNTEIAEAIAAIAKWRAKGRITQRVNVAQAPKSKLPPSRLPARQRARYLKFKGNQPRSEWAKKYGSLNIKCLFFELASTFNISDSAARARYYRGKVAPDVLAECRNRIKTP